MTLWKEHLGRIGSTSAATTSDATRSTPGSFQILPPGGSDGGEVEVSEDELKRWSRNRRLPKLIMTEREREMFYQKIIFLGNLR